MGKHSARVAKAKAKDTTRTRKEVGSMAVLHDTNDSKWWTQRADAIRAELDLRIDRLGATGRAYRERVAAGDRLYSLLHECHFLWHYFGLATVDDCVGWECYEATHSAFIELAHARGITRPERLVPAIA